MGTTVAHQLSHARQAAHEDLAALARRTGVRQENLRAIEDGRFGDLPPGIYGRAAVKSFANAFGFDGAAMLAECEALLTPLDEPIAALARSRGLRVRPHEALPVREPAHAAVAAVDPDAAGWRHLAAAAIDAGVVGALLLAVVVAALTLLTAPVSALRDGGGAFAIMGMVLAGGYYFCFGGVRGVTVGERLVGIERRSPAGAVVTIHVALERALLAATEDARWFQRCGERLGRSSAGWMSSAAGEAKG
jgi:hypothetical protein